MPTLLKTNLPVSRTVLQISRIKANLDIFFPTKDKKASKIYVLFLFKDGYIFTKSYLILAYVGPF